MKHCSCLLPALLAGMTLGALERIPQEEITAHIINPRPGFVTEHLDWGKQLPRKQKLKILFVVPSAGFRDIQELAQRQDMDVTVFGTETEKKLGRHRELNAKLSGKYDVIVLGNVNFTSLPNEAQYKILTAVEQGCGLLLAGNNPKPGYQKLYSNPIPSPRFPSNFTTQPVDAPRNFKAWKLGKGILAELRYPVRRGWEYRTGDSLAPRIRQDRKFAALHENSMALLLRSIRFTADGKDSAWNAKSDGKTLSLQGTAAFPVTARIRDTENNLIWSGSMKHGRLELPPLAAGSYFCDLVSNAGEKSFDAAVLPLEIPASHGKMTMKLDAASVRNKGPVRGSLQWEKPLEKGGKMVISMLDSPDFKVWRRVTLPVAKGERNLRFELKNYHLPAIAGSIRCELFDADGKALDKEEREMFFPESGLEEYFQFGWGGATNLNLARQMHDIVGWKGALAHPNEVQEDSLAHFNQRLVSYVVRIELMKGPNGEVQQPNWFFLPENARRDLKSLNKDECFYRPEVQELWRKGIRHRLGFSGNLNPAIYSLGDENNFSYEAGFGASDRKYFREFLRKKYKTTAAYNREHSTNYSSFDEIPQQTLKEARDAGNYPAWLDHREYMEQMYADLHHFLRTEIRKIVPDALVGSEGSVPGNLEVSMDQMEFWGPYNDVIESEVLRSFGREKIRALWWGGYAPDDPLPSQAKFMMLGTANASAWYITLSTDTYTAFGSDGLPAPAIQKYLPVLDRLRFGLGTLFNAVPMEPPQVLFYWSPQSNAASLLDERFANPRDGQSTLIAFCYRNGIPFEFVSARRPDRLENSGAKVLFLCGTSSLSAEECRRIAKFAERGGTVIADRSPALLNEYLRVLPAGNLSELFGKRNLAELKQPKMTDSFQISTQGGAKLESAKALVTPERLFWQKKKHGKGRGILAGFNFAVVSATSKGEHSLDAFLRRELAESGVVPRFRVTGNQFEAILRNRKAADHELFSVWIHRNDVGKTLALTLPEKAWIYDLFGKSEHHAQKISWKDNSNALRVFGIFQQKQTPPELRVEQEKTRGESCRIDLSRVPPGRVIGLHVFDPAGKELRTRNLVVNRAHTEKTLFHTSPDDPAGRWRIRAVDQSTGLSSDYHITLK